MEIIKKKNHSNHEFTIFFCPDYFIKFLAGLPTALAKPAQVLFCKSLYHDFSITSKHEDKSSDAKCSSGSVILLLSYYLLWHLKHTANTGSLNIVC